MRDVLNRLIEEEAQAGWVLLEKFDDYRVRFKRPVSARVKDAYLPEGVDPYRTYYGTAVQSTLWALMLGLILAAVLGVGVLFSMNGAMPMEGSIFWVLITVLVLLPVGVLAAVAKRRMQR